METQIILCCVFTCKLTINFGAGNSQFHLFFFIDYHPGMLSNVIIQDLRSRGRQVNSETQKVQGQPGLLETTPQNKNKQKSLKYKTNIFLKKNNKNTNWEVKYLT